MTEKPIMIEAAATKMRASPDVARSTRFVILYELCVRRGGGGDNRVGPADVRGANRFFLD
jgi:hypothetical protein